MPFLFKPLRWITLFDEDDGSVDGSRAATLFGYLAVSLCTDGVLWGHSTGRGRDLQDAKTIEEAEAAAERWYQAKLAATLMPLTESEAGWTGEYPKLTAAELVASAEKVVGEWGGTDAVHWGGAEAHAVRVCQHVLAAAGQSVRDGGERG